MKRLIAILIALLGLTLSANGQLFPGRLLDFLSRPTGTAKKAVNIHFGPAMEIIEEGDYVLYTPTALFEVRVNNLSDNGDMSLRIGYNHFQVGKIDDVLGHRDVKAFTMINYFDYNLRYWDNVAPYFGMGVGISYQPTIHTELVNGREEVYEHARNHSAIGLRMGVELWDWVRVELSQEYRTLFTSTYLIISIVL